MPESRKLTLAALAASAFALALYLPSLANGFVNWDDPNYVTGNAALGLGAVDYLTWAGTALYSNNWHPLTWLSIGVEHALFGRDSATGYHATSALLFAASCFLVVRLVATLLARAGVAEGARLAAATAVGVLFAAHPLHVESVAWVSERKDVLYAFFFLASLAAYLRFVDAGPTKRRRWYLASLGLFALSILSKPMAVSLPIVLLILDAYPLARLRRSTATRIAGVEKLPFYAISLASSAMTIWAQSAGGALGAVHIAPFDRVLLAVRALGFYLLKFVWPVKLAPLYPLPDAYSLTRLEFIAPLLLCLAITVVALRLAPTKPILLAAWSFFVVTLVPVVGLVSVGNQAAADRYMNLPMLGPLVLVGAGVAVAWQGPRKLQRGATALAALVAALLSFLSLNQIAIWSDSVSLWEHQIAIYPRSVTARQNLGLGYQDAGELEAAEAQWEIALEIQPGHPWAATDLGNLKKERGDLAGAEELYRAAIESDPNFAVAHMNLAMTLEQLGRRSEATKHYRIFVRIAPPHYAHVAAQVRAKLSGY